MSHHYIRHNYGDNCFYPDNSFKRYNRYNDSHGDTLIFNYNYGGVCDGGIGICAGNSFWSGLGAGLTNGLMGILGGFMGGMGNIFGMGMPMFGLGGMSAYSTSGLTSGYPYDYSSSVTNNSTSNNTSSSSTKHDSDCTDADEMNAHSLINKLKEIQAKPEPDAAELKKLYGQVKVLVDNPLDSAHKTGNKDTYSLLLNSIKTYAKEKGIDLNAPDDKKDNGKVENPVDPPANNNGTTVNPPVNNNGTTVNPPANNNETTVNPPANNDVRTVNPPAIELTPEEKALAEKVADIKGKTPEQIKAAYPTTAERVGLLNQLKDKTDDDSKEARKLLKQSFYKTGNTNVAMTDLDNETSKADIEKFFINIIDTSDIKDIMGVTNVKISKDSDGKYQLKCTYKGNELTYGYVEEIDGELIFHGMQMKGDTQHYVLQKNSDGKYELMQYEYHLGHGTVDYTK